MAGKSEEQRSLWASNLEHTLQIMREYMDNIVYDEFRILKVPKFYRHPNAEYTPVEWRFGLHNRDKNVDMSDSEATKRAVVVLFGLDKPSIWREFCNAVVPDPKAMLKCYGLHKEVNDMLEDEIKQVLALDALFLAVFMEFYASMRMESLMWLPNELWNSPKWRYFRDNFYGCYDMVEYDLCKIENQIPFDLIKRAINHVHEPTNPRQENDKDCASRTGSLARELLTDAYLERWMKTAVEGGMAQFMEISNDFYGDANATERLYESYHILGSAHKVICGVNGMKRTSDSSQKDYIHVPSATRLKESGIVIEGVVGSLSNMSYDKKQKCLYMPKMTLYDLTVSVVRNMARYEEFCIGKDYCMFHDYVFLMLDLIQTPLDLNHLIKCGVIHNGCGNKGVYMWRALEEGINFIWSSKEHNVMKSDINERCKLRRHRLWSEFKTLFLSRPWLTVSAVAITLVTLATLIQTYATVISSNGMKPQFKP